MKGYFEHSVDVSISKNGELYGKMKEISKEMGLSMESVANLLIRVGLDIHMEKNANDVLKLDKE
jgi:hypothetical protein